MEEDHKHSLLQPLIPFLLSRSSSATSTASTTTTTTFTAAAAAATSCYSLHDTNQHHDNNTDTRNNNAKLFISDKSILLRILLVLSVALISIWANYEASKTFEITIVNDAKDSLAGHRFDLSYVSNDRATRIVLNTSSFVEHLLYPNNNNNNSQHYSKKQIHSVTLRLAPRNLNATATATVSATGNRYCDGGKSFNCYVIDISPTLLEYDENYIEMAIVGAIQRAMVRVWLWDGGSSAPPGLVDGIVEYVAELAGFHRKRFSGNGGVLPECDGHQHGWWVDKDPSVVAGFLHYCEGYKRGFIQRLNEAMRDTWHDRMVDDVLGIPATKLCGFYNASSLNLI